MKTGKDHELVKYIENKTIKDKYSPSELLGEIEEIEEKGLKFNTKICTKTVYKYIDWGDVFLRLTKKELPVKKLKRKCYTKRENSS